MEHFPAIASQESADHLLAIGLPDVEDKDQIETRIQENSRRCQQMSGNFTNSTCIISHCAHRARDGRAKETLALKPRCRAQSTVTSRGHVENLAALSAVLLGKNKRV